eukprot:3819484-Rhodomonas_salina.1
MALRQSLAVDDYAGRYLLRLPRSRSYPTIRSIIDPTIRSILVHCCLYHHRQVGLQKEHVGGMVVLKRRYKAGTEVLYRAGDTFVLRVGHLCTRVSAGTERGLCLYQGFLLCSLLGWQYQWITRCGGEKARIDSVQVYPLSLHRPTTYTLLVSYDRALSTVLARPYEHSLGMRCAVLR